MKNPLQNTPDMKTGIEIQTKENRNSLLWWIAKYFHEYATGNPATLKLKAQDLKHFHCWYFSFKENDEVKDFSRATANQYITHLINEKIEAPHGNKEKGAKRWANRSINRKIDHLKGFTKWLFSQVPTPLVHNPMEKVKRLDVPTLNAKRIDPVVLEALTTTALHLEGTERRKDLNRFKIGRMPLKKTARPLRDYAIFSLLKGSGIRVQALCNLNVDQIKGRRLIKVKEKGSQERDVVISKEAYQSVKHYIETERAEDSTVWEHSKALFLSVAQTKTRNPGATGRMDTSTIRKIIKKIAVKTLGKEGAKEIHPHLFRHHVGHVMEKNGGITAVQKQLGHKNIAYSSVYCQKTDNELERFLDKENDL